MKLTASPYWLLLLIPLLASCASGPQFDNKLQPNDASIRCEQIGLGDTMSGDLMVAINQIDGSEIAGRKKGAIYYVQPGKHELELTFGRLVTRQLVHQYLQFETIANHKYLLKASKKDDDFRVEAVDETDPKATSVVATVKVKSSLPPFLPIPIPVK